MSFLPRADAPWRHRAAWAAALVVLSPLAAACTDGHPAPDSETDITPAPSATENITFFEGFDKPLDPAVWEVYSVESDKATYGEGNEQLGLYSADNVTVDTAEGVLELTAEREHSAPVPGDNRFLDGRDHTSGALESVEAIVAPGSTIEIVAQLPEGNTEGFAPTGYLRAEEGPGLIGVFKVRGGEADEPRVVTQELAHSWGPGAPDPVTQTSPVEQPEGWHTYAAELSTEGVVFSVDGEPTLAAAVDAKNPPAADSDVPVIETPWVADVVDGSSTLRFEHIVGGTFAGNPTDATQFPATTKIDSVTVTSTTAPGSGSTASHDPGAALGPERSEAVIRAAARPAGTSARARATR